MAWGARLGLKHDILDTREIPYARLNGLGSPFGFETTHKHTPLQMVHLAKWPGEPV